MMQDPPPPSGPPSNPPPPSGDPIPGPPPPTAIGSNHLQPIGDWLTDTTRTLIHGFGDFFAVLTVVALVTTAISAPLLWWSSTDAIFTRDDAGNFTDVEGMTASQGFMVAAGVLIVLVGQILLFTAATNHIDRSRAGVSPRWQETMQALVARGPRVLGVVVQVMLATFVILIVSGLLSGIGLGAVGGLVGLVVIVLMWVRAAVAATHAALGGPGGSVAASLAWTKGLTWPLLGRHILLATIAVGVLFIGSLFAAPFQSLSGAAVATDGDLVLRELIGSSLSGFLAVQLINALVSGVVAALWAAAMLSLYRSEPLER